MDGSQPGLNGDGEILPPVLSDSVPASISIPNRVIF